MKVFSNREFQNECNALVTQETKKSFFRSLQLMRLALRIIGS